MTIKTLDVQYMTHLYAIVYPGPVFYHLGGVYIHIHIFTAYIFGQSIHIVEIVQFTIFTVHTLHFVNEL